MSSLVEFPQSVPGREPVRRGADGILHYGDLNPALTELLDIRAHRYADREAIIEIDGPRLTYRELWTSASKIAGALQDRGIGVGERVAIRLPEGARWVQAFFGALLSGAVPVPVNDSLGAAELAHILDDSAVDFVLDDEDLPQGRPFIDDGASLGETALLCYTNGTHGRPKGVELSNENLLSAVASVVGALGLPDTGIRSLLALPLAHASGCVHQLLPTLAVGGTVVLAPGADPDRFAHVLGTESVDLLATTVEQLRRLRTRTHSVATVCCSGGGLDADLAGRIGASFPGARQRSLWGATETSGIGLLADACGCVGRPIGGTEIALWGPDAADGRGELLLRGPNVTREYWNNPTATAAALHRRLVPQRRPRRDLRRWDGAGPCPRRCQRSRRSRSRVRIAASTPIASRYPVKSPYRSATVAIAIR